MNNTTNHTPAPRLPLNMEVSFRRSYARNSVSGHLRNISLTGAFLETVSSSLAASDKIIVTFIVSGRKRNISATIIWKNNVGCGLKFQPFNNRDVQIVDDLMYFVESTRESRKSVLDDIIKRVS